MYPLKLKYRKNRIRSSWNVTNDFSVVYRVTLLKVSHKVLVVKCRGAIGRYTYDFSVLNPKSEIV